jgi:hypothetical protein
MSTTAERLAKLGLLAVLEGWTRERFDQECLTRYPLGPTPEGPPWDDPLVVAEVDRLWQMIETERQS